MGSAGLAAASADTQFGAVTVEKEPLGPGIEEPTGPAIELDAEQYAIDYGVTTQEAVRRLERIPELKPVLQGIADAEKGRVAGRSIVHEPEFGGWIYLVGEHEATTATMELLSRNKDVFLELGATHTLAELDAAMSERSNFESIPDSMRARIAYREIDIRSNSLVIAINGDVAPVPLNETSATGPLGSAPIESLPLPQAAAVAGPRFLVHLICALFFGPGLWESGGGTSTDARSRYGDRYLSSFAEIGSEIDITRNADGTITLTRDNLVITAEPA